MNRHRLAEERSLALHRAIADRMATDASVLDRARRRVQRWLEKGEVPSYWAKEWEAVLDRPLAQFRAWLVDESEHAKAMRQVTPFAGAIDPRTRWRIWREVRAKLEQAG